MPENCIQCNQCSFVCPHATIRPILATEAEVAAAPEHFDTIPALGAKDLQFRIAVSPLDCLGSVTVLISVQLLKAKLS